MRVKVAYIDGKACRFGPEYDDCKALSMEKGVPVREVYAEALSAAKKRFT